MALLVTFVASALPSQAATITSRPNQELRLATIGYRLSVANADACAKPQRLTGLLLHELGQYDAPDRAGVATTFALGDGFGVLNVVADSAGARAGLRRGDEIVAVNGRDLPAAFPVSAKQAGSYDRSGAFEQYLAGALAGGPAELRVRRGGVMRIVSLASDAGCGGDVVLTRSGVLNAWSDGRYVSITTKLADFAGDDEELAFVVAHEMSHNILEHGAKLGLSGNALFDSVSPALFRMKGTEVEADQFAVRLMKQAGYGLNGASSFLQRSAKMRWMDLPLTHPGISRRLAIIAKAGLDLDRSAATQSPGAAHVG